MVAPSGSSKSFQNSNRQTPLPASRSTNQKDVQHDVTSVLVSSAIILLATSILTVTPATTLAATTSEIGTNPTSYSNTIFNHEYADPFHPLCKRKIEVNPDGKTFHYSGTAVGPKDDPVRRGCSADEIEKYGLRQGAFDGEVLSGNRISAGDGVHEGVWEPANSASTNLGFEAVDGVRWNDGNKWTVVENTVAGTGRE